LAVHGVCPECGKPIQLSLRGDDLRFSSPKWLSDVASGVRLVAIGTVLRYLDSLMVASVWPPAHPISIVIAVTAAAIVVLGGWRFTQPEPGEAQLGRDGVLRKIIRWGLLAELVRVAIEIAKLWNVVPPTYGRAASSAIALIWVVTLLAQLQYLSRLTRRVPGSSLSNWFDVVASGLLLIVPLFLFVVLMQISLGGLGSCGLIFLWAAGCLLLFMHVVLLFCCDWRLRSMAMTALAAGGRVVPVPSPGTPGEG
jgi:hypothetical protein